MKKHQQILTSLLVLLCCVNLACGGGLTLGPRVETRTVIVGVGQPIQILETITVRGKRLDSDIVVKQNIGGWVAMPVEHFDVLLDAAQKSVDKENANNANN